MKACFKEWVAPDSQPSQTHQHTSSSHLLNLASLHSYTLAFATRDVWRAVFTLRNRFFKEAGAHEVLEQAANEAGLPVRPAPTFGDLEGLRDLLTDLESLRISS